MPHISNPNVPNDIHGIYGQNSQHTEYTVDLYPAALPNIYLKCMKKTRSEKSLKDKTHASLLLKIVHLG